MHLWGDFIYLIFTRIRRIMTTEDGSSWRMTSAHATPLPTQRNRRNLWVIIEGSYVRPVLACLCWPLFCPHMQSVSVLVSSVTALISCPNFVPLGSHLIRCFQYCSMFFPSTFRLTLQKFQINVFVVLFFWTVSKSPFLIGLFDEQYFVLNWLIIRCKLRPELRQKRSWQHEARRINSPYYVREIHTDPNYKCVNERTADKPRAHKPCIVFYSVFE